MAILAIIEFDQTKLKCEMNEKSKKFISIRNKWIKTQLKTQQTNSQTLTVELLCLIQMRSITMLFHRDSLKNQNKKKPLSLSPPSTNKNPNLILKTQAAKRPNHWKQK